MRALAAVALAFLIGTASAASAQTPAASAGDARAIAARAEGYPDDISVMDEGEPGGSGARGLGADGAGHGPRGRIGLHGDRDGGEAAHRFDIPMPDFVRDLLAAFSQLLGAAAVPVGYVLFAIGIALVIALLVYLVVMMRIPKADIEARRRDRSATNEPVLDPLLEGSDASAEEHAAKGRYREAIHALFLRALRDATRAGDVDRRGRTAREVVGLVERVHGSSPQLAELLSLTELVWFGGRGATEEEYLAARVLASAVEASARSEQTALAIGAPA